MQAFPDTDNVPNGDDRSELVRHRCSLEIHVETSGLDPESPYTLWVVVFDNPEYCHTEPCAEADLPVSPGHDPRVDASVAFAGGISEADDTGRFLGRIRTIRGEITSARLFGTGTLDPRHAEVHVVVRGHGQPPPKRCSRRSPPSMAAARPTTSARGAGTGANGASSRGRG